MVSVVLIEPEHPGNIGAVARIMANFGYDRLVLVAPRCDHLCDESRNRAKHAQGILDNAKTVLTLPDFDCIIATTAQIGTQYNLKRTPLLPESLAKVVPKAGDIAVIFGRETTGLTNDEIRKADFIVTIPSAQGYPTLNLSHSVGIILYELSKSKPSQFSRFTPLKRGELDKMYSLFDQTVASLPFKDDLARDTQKMVWKKILSRAFLTKREAYVIMGFLRKLLK